MATLLNNTEIKKLFGTVIMDADESCVRPNSYVLRLGAHGKFIHTEKEFEIGENKHRGIRLGPGHAVGITALEKIDFSPETVGKIFPGCSLHGFLSPTTDLSREAILAPSTQVDAGYTGTLNWTITNNSGQVAEFVYAEKLFRLTIVCLKEGESPSEYYQGDYQDQDGYVSSKRGRAPRNMKEAEWVNSSTEGGPEEMLGELIKSGYPWNILGTRLLDVDNQLKTVTYEYEKIKKSIDGFKDYVQKLFDDNANALTNRWLVLLSSVLGALVFGVLWLVLFLHEFPVLWDAIVNNLHIALIVLAIVIAALIIFAVKMLKK